MKPLILFDIDDTLINTQLLKRLQVTTIAQYLNITIKQMEEFRLNYLNSLEATTDFSTHDYLEILAKEQQVDIKKLTEVFWTPTNFQICLFPEVKDVLASLRHQQYDLGVFSEGYTDFQIHKLTANGLLPFFNQHQLHIYRRKLNPTIIEQLPNGTVIVDDKNGVIEYLENFPNVIPLRIVRDPAQAHQLINSRYTLLDLRELLPLLTSLNHLS